MFYIIAGIIIIICVSLIGNDDDSGCVGCGCSLMLTLLLLIAVGAVVVKLIF